MLAKLAKRNVKRQVGNYLVYFATITLSIAMMFAFCNLIFSEQLAVIADSSSGISSGMVGLTAFVASITAFVLAYASSYMLKLRKKEFGTYLTLGMRRSDILKIFSCETMIISVVALASGIVIGAFASQGLMALLCIIMDTQVKLAAYSLKGLILTAALAGGMFLFSLVISARYLRKVTVQELLLEEKHKKEIRFPVLRAVAAVISFGGIIYTYIGAFKGLMSSMKDDSSVPLMLYLFIFSICIFIFHASFSASINEMLLKNKKLAARSTNTFLFRQLSDKVAVNSVMIGFVSLLLTFTVLGTNLCITEKVMKDSMIDRETPFDVTARFNADEEHKISMEQGEKIIEKYSPIIEKVPYEVLTSGKNELGKGIEGIDEDSTDSYMPLSQFNAILRLNGKEPVSLDNGCLIVSTFFQSINADDFVGKEIKLNSKTYPIGGVSGDYPLYSYSYFYAVVPDEATEGMEVETYYMAYDLQNDRYDAASLSKELTWYRLNEDGRMIDENDYNLREENRLRSDALVGVLVVGSMYASVVFICIAFAVISIKDLSTLDEDKKSYRILSRLGVSVSEQKKVLRKQMFFFFIIPFAIPFSLCLPTGITLGKLMALLSLPEQGSAMTAASASIALIFAAVYLIYYIITVSIAQKNVIDSSK